jgi:hypothetical protein
MKSVMSEEFGNGIRTSRSTAEQMIYAEKYGNQRLWAIQKS